MHGSKRAGTGWFALAGVGALLVAPLAWVGAAAAEPAGAQRGATETVVVQLTSSAAVHPSSVLGAVSASALRAAPANRYLLRVPATEAASTVARLRAEPGVRFAEIPQVVHATDTNDQCYSAPGCLADDDQGTAGLRYEYYLNTIQAPAAWTISKGDGVSVGVIDSGADATNPDLTGKINFQQDCLNDAPCTGAGMVDDFGHGTHVSGILAANTNTNGFGIASLGWNVHLDEFKVLDSTGAGDTFDVANAIYAAIGAGVRVINMSLACSDLSPPCGPDPDEGAAVEAAISHGVVVVAAAGNDGLDAPAFPASYPGVLSVAATDQQGAIAWFSQYGSAANIAAPGVGIVSDWPMSVPGSPCSELCVEDGTSMASPQVAAAAALLISRYPSLSGPQVAEILESTAGPTAGGHPINGGLLNAYAALLAGNNPPPTRYNGYELAGADGSVYSFGTVGAFGDLYGRRLAQPVVGTALKNDGTGYWLVASDGGVFSFGSAGFFGSTGGIRLNKPIAGMAATPSGNGYWLVASDGGVFAFGDARFFGSTGGIRLNKPIVGMAATPSGNGYWLVASDGGVFAFGDAGFYGSTGGIRLNKPVVAMAASNSGHGYWLVASDGGVFTYGDAPFRGSTGGIRLVQPIVGVAPTPSGQGYWLVASDGGVFAFGPDARFYGSTGGLPIPAPVVAAAS
jgi:subtilisin family serine protease